VKAPLVTPDRARPLGATSLLLLGINGIVGVGIFFAPSEVAGSVSGYAGTAVFLTTALALAPIAWAYAALGGRYHVDGGPFVWAREAFGVTFAFFVGWITYATALFSVAAVITGLATHAAPALGIQGAAGGRILALVCLLSLTAVAASGLRPSAVIWSTLTLLKLIPLAALIVLGVVADAQGRLPTLTASSANFARAALIVLFTTQGFESVSVVAGSVRRPERAVPWATLGSLAVAALLYAALYTVCVYAVPNLAESRAPLVDAARALGGPGAATLVAIGANVSATGITFAMIVMAPRYLSVLGDKAALGP
jgi:amino acid transporter